MRNNFYLCQIRIYGFPQKITFILCLNIINERLLLTEYHFFFSELNKNPVEGFSAGLVDESDIHKWEVLIIGPPDTL